ncbi:MAG: LytTR family DNA-binding domain-containing protein [Clostridiaceae bacterium]|nr:LytTR family DNA-binding domain-containing protein [Clostridiaceae bacterium]
MTYTVGVCDDSPQQVELFIHYLKSYPGNDDFKIVRSTDPAEFLLKLKQCPPHLVLLDIDMGSCNGIQLGGTIKELFGGAVVVYITAYEKYALEAFRIRAFHYLLKPLTREKFNQMLEEAINLFRKEDSAKTEKTLAVQLKGEILNLKYSEIDYFEKIGHRIKIHTQSGEFFFYDNLNSLLMRLDKNSFFQCHQGYIVNIGKIRAFRDKMLFLDGGLQIPVSRSFADIVKEVLTRRLFT